MHLIQEALKAGESADQQHPGFNQTGVPMERSAHKRVEMILRGFPYQGSRLAEWISTIRGLEPERLFALEHANPVCPIIPDIDKAESDVPVVHFAQFEYLVVG